MRRDIHYHILKEESSYPLWFNLSTTKDLWMRELANQRGFGIGATLYQKPVGLILARFGKTKSQASISFLKVDEEHLHQGIGSCLVNELLCLCKGVGVSCLSVTYSEELSWSCYLEQILDRNWFLTRYHYHYATIAVDSLSSCYHRVREQVGSRALHRPNAFQIIPYSKRTKEMGDSLEVLAKKHLHALSPLGEEAILNEEGSFLLCKGKDVGGWLVLSNVSDKDVLVRALFVREDLRNTGLFLRLLFALAEYLTTPSSIERCLFQTNLQNKRFLKTLRRLFEGTYSEELFITRERHF